jgi:hypothetical protein
MTRSGVNTMSQPIQLCGHCKQFKALEDYVPSKRGEAGAQCKSCANASRHREGKSTVPHEPRQCVHCGRWYVPKQLKRKPMYCSRQCWADARKAKAAAARLAKTCCVDRSCDLHHNAQRCGHCKQFKLLEEYIPSHRGIAGSWCKPCHVAYARGEQRPSALHEPQQCVQCGGSYIPAHLYEQRANSSKYCSEECNQATKTG